MQERIFNKFYSELNPKEFYDFDLQRDLALEAINFYVVFNNLALIDIEIIAAPYIFTKLGVHYDLYGLVSQVGDINEFQFSPDCNGGMTAIYIGPKETILTLDMDNIYNLEVEYISKESWDKKVFSYEVPIEEKIYSAREMLKGFI